MIYKILKLSIVCSTLIMARSGFEYSGIPIKVLTAKGEIKDIIVKRDIPDACKKLPINNEMVWTGNFASSKVPEACKSTYVHCHP